MRILQISDCFLPIVDGVCRVVYSYANTLGKLGEDVTVVAPRSKENHKVGHPFKVVDFASFPFQQYRTGVPLADREYHKRIAKAQPEIIHAHSPFVAGYEALRLKKKFSVPLVASFHSKYYDDFKKIFKSEKAAKFLTDQVVAFYEKCDLVYAVSEDTAKVLRGYGYKGRLKVMPNGTDLRPIDDAAAAKIRAKYEGEKLLLFVGQMNWKKNILRILEVMALLRQEGLPVRLLMAGQGPDEQAIRRKVKFMGLGDAVSFLGHLSDRDTLDAYYRASDLFLFPSLYDNAPMVVREAAVMETPSLLIRGCSAAEVVEHGLNGFTAANTAKEIAACVKEALADEELLQIAGLSAKHTIPVAWEGILQEVLSDYRLLIRENKK